MHPWLFQYPPISMYGVCIVAGIVSGWLWARRRARRAGMDASHIDLMVPLLTATGLAGAWAFGRLADAATGEEVHALVLVGVLLAATAAGILYCLKARLPLGVMGDVFAAPVAWSIGIGRVGCFFAGCCYGKPCAGGIGVRFPVASPAYVDQLSSGALAMHAANSLPVYPVQLYEAALCILLAAFLLKNTFKQGVPGESFLALGAGYAVIRFATEFLRGDNPAMLTGLTFSQCAAIVITAVTVLTWHTRRRFAHQLGLAV